MGVIFWRFLLQYASPALASFLYLIRVGGLEFENLPRDTCDIGILNRDYGGSLPANI